MNFPLAGNDGVKNAFEQAKKNCRVPHALIIEGERGSGKSTLADYIVATCVCESEEKPCGNCKSCHLVRASTHPDVYYIAPEEKKKSIGVEQIRKMRIDAYIRPHLSECKVFNINCADTLSPQSQNTILKILEEPPGNIVFILQVTSRASLLPTILSRCVTYTLKEPALSVAAEYISGIENISFKDAEELLKRNGLQIGSALTSLKSRKKDETYRLATEYLECADYGSIYDMLLITQPLEKERVQAFAFFNHLAFLLLSGIKQKAIKGEDISLQMERHQAVVRAQEMLQSNVNLPLLFSKIAADFK